MHIHSSKILEHGFKLDFIKAISPHHCFLFFLFIFEIFFIFFTFQAYKQSKHEYRIKLGFPPEEGIQMNDNFVHNNNDDNNEGNNEEGNNNNNENNNQGGFQPFQGHGVAVGGGDNN